MIGFKMGLDQGSLFPDGKSERNTVPNPFQTHLYHQGCRLGGFFAAPEDAARLTNSLLADFLISNPRGLSKLLFPDSLYNFSALTGSFPFDKIILSTFKCSVQSQFSVQFQCSVQIQCSVQFQCSVYSLFSLNVLCCLYVLYSLNDVLYSLNALYSLNVPYNLNVLHSLNVLHTCMCIVQCAWYAMMQCLNVFQSSLWFLLVFMVYTYKIPNDKVTKATKYLKFCDAVNTLKTFWKTLTEFLLLASLEHNIMFTNGGTSINGQFSFLSVIVSLKGQSNEIFDLRFFSSVEPVWATDQQVKIFLILVQNLPSYTNFKFENLTPRDIIPR